MAKYTAEINLEFHADSWDDAFTKLAEHLRNGNITIGLVLKEKKKR